MAQPQSRAGKTPLLPPGVAPFLRKRLQQVLGLALAALAGALGAALLSFNIADPSWNTASDAPVTNALGQGGAVISDLMVQSLGIAAALPVLVFLIWGIRLISLQGLDRLWLRLLLLPTGALLAACGAAALPPPALWPLTVGLGGVSGEILLGSLLGALGPAWVWAVAPVSALAGLAAIGAAFGYAWSEWARLGAGLARAFARITTGVTAGALSGLGRLAGVVRTLARAKPSLEASPATAGVGASRVRREPRLEPHLERSASTAAQPAQSPRNAPLDPARAHDLVAPRAPHAPQSRKGEAARQGSLALPRDEQGYVPPSLDLLALPESRGVEKVNQEALAQNARFLESVLDDFGVQGEIVKVRPGPVVTLYELEPAPGTKTSRVIGLADDIARSMSAVSVRIAVVPGRSVIGIELPNQKRETVFLRELLASKGFESSPARLALALGKDIGGAPVIVDLARMPHLLIAGTTGSGKSVAVNTMILSLLYRLSPEHCRLIMIDPKMLELSVYDGIPHLLAPVVTDPSKAVVALKWTVREMENRYRAMSQLGVRNIDGYNQRLADARRKGESLSRTVQTGFDDEGRPVYEEQPLDLSPLPYIVVVVDEMADLMLVAGKDVEAAIQRLAQMARAAGIHLIMATQRPSVDVITGTIKANFPTRVSFQVTSKIDSRTILGEQGAEQLLGQGDMLYMAAGGRIMRVHGPFVSDEEVEAAVAHLRDLGEPEYVEDVTEEEDASDIPGMGGESGDTLYDQAVSIVLRERKASTSFIQRQLQIGYNRAARIIEQMEAQGVVSRANHVGKREVLPPGGPES